MRARVRRRVRCRRELVDADGVTAVVTSHDAMLEQYADGVLELVDGIITDD